MWRALASVTWPNNTWLQWGTTNAAWLVTMQYHCHTLLQSKSLFKVVLVAHMAGKLIGIISDLLVVWCLNRLQVHGLNRTHMSQQQLLRCVVHALILKLTQEPTCFLTYLMMWMDPTQHAFTTLVSTHSKIGLLPSKLLLLLHHWYRSYCFCSIQLLTF